MPSAKITSKGQITVPKEIRDALNLRPGDRIAFVIHEDHTVQIVPQKKDLRELYGSIEVSVRGVTLEEMESAVGDGAIE